MEFLNNVFIFITDQANHQFFAGLLIGGLLSWYLTTKSQKYSHAKLSEILKEKENIIAQKDREIASLKSQIKQKELYYRDVFAGVFRGDFSIPMPPNKQPTKKETPNEKPDSHST